MIRINLINNKVAADEAGGGQGILITNDKQGQRENIIKVILMLTAVVGLYFYESHNIDQLTAQFKAKKAQADKGVAEINELRKTAGKAEEVEKEINQLQEKLNILQELSKKRLRELKALDFLQTMIPDGVWLSNVSYDGQGVQFKGSALNDKEMEVFVSGLNESSYFDEVVVLKQTIEKTDTGSIKKFEISTVMATEGLPGITEEVVN
ncbi:MAG: hypothetical protein CL677_05735 [Bdellovibrionaceae bacterium]|nr:hypothetical protein [Pseudobdellovibrionaceae bacterium]|tara:strand:- start:10091 stop:10714 length:624 start_codon:yes stop_codon:yes gene_type:complete